MLLKKRAYLEVLIKQMNKEKKKDKSFTELILYLGIRRK
jgi:hypothetical protein